MKTDEHQKTVLHSFETTDLGRIDLLIYAGVYTWPNDGSLRSIWLPQLYIASDDMLANFTGSNVDRYDMYPRTVFEDAYNREFVLYHVGPICERSGLEAFDPVMQLFKIEKIEVARPMGATASLCNRGIIFAGSDQRQGRRLPDLRN